MRAVLVILMMLVQGPTWAQRVAPPRSSPAIIAFDLYMTCIRGEFAGSYPEIESAAELATYLQYLDEKCITWTVVWFPAFTGYTMDKMSSDRTGTFIMLRRGVVEDIRKQLALGVPTTKK